MEGKFSGNVKPISVDLFKIFKHLGGGEIFGEVKFTANVCTVFWLMSSFPLINQSTGVNAMSVSKCMGSWFRTPTPVKVCFPNQHRPASTGGLWCIQTHPTIFTLRPNHPMSVLFSIQHKKTSARLACFYIFSFVLTHSDTEKEREARVTEDASRAQRSTQEGGLTPLIRSLQLLKSHSCRWGATVFHLWPESCTTRTGPFFVCHFFLHFETRMNQAICCG